MLSLTCKNTSHNDTVTAELDHLLPTFSPVNRTRCFSHVLNLIAKSFIRQFDIDWRSDNLKEEEDLNDEERSLLELAGSIGEEERTMAQEDDEDEVVEEDDSLEGWVDEVDALTDRERRNLGKLIGPVRRLLVKVRDRYVNGSYPFLTTLYFSFESSPSRSFTQPSCYLCGRHVSRD